MTTNNLKRWFRLFRARQGITQNQMAEDIKIGQHYLSAIENLDAHLTDKTIGKLRICYNLTDEDVEFLSGFKRKGKNTPAHYRYENKKIARQKDQLEKAYLLALAHIVALENGEKPEIDRAVTLYEYFLEEAKGKSEDTNQSKH